jgi:hypothetical protein
MYEYCGQGSKFCDLKGQCHEMVVKIRPLISRLGLNKGSQTLIFRLKIGRFKAILVQSKASTDVKSGFSVPADFAI